MGAVTLSVWSSTLIRGLTLPRRGLPPVGLIPDGVMDCSMPLGLIVGGPFRPFSRAISSRCAATVCFNAPTSASSPKTKSLSSATVSESRSDAGGTRMKNPKNPPTGIGKLHPRRILQKPVTVRTRFAVAQELSHAASVATQAVARGFAGITENPHKWLISGLLQAGPCRFTYL
jgi:hypothetical protein